MSCGRSDKSRYFSEEPAGKRHAAPCGCAFDGRFACTRQRRRYNARDSILNPVASRTTVNVHRFEEIINGREYHIEVSSVGTDKWRAQIARLPGGSAALMPFYGKTPVEAAGQLSRWLTIAHGQRQSQV
jgi:hypothetical protein